jgi:hypothetical protein
VLIPQQGTFIGCVITAAFSGWSKNDGTESPCTKSKHEGAKEEFPQVFRRHVRKNLAINFILASASVGRAGMAVSGHQQPKSAGLLDHLVCGGEQWPNTESCA